MSDFVDTDWVDIELNDADLVEAYNLHRELQERIEEWIDFGMPIEMIESMKMKLRKIEAKIRELELKDHVKE